MVNSEIENQINQCLDLLKDMFGRNLLGVYLYGSSIVGGLQKYSDIDLFVVLDRSTTLEEKAKLSIKMLKISGVYMEGSKLPIEMTIVKHSDINPWHYPPNFDYQYGDWLREEFENGIIEPWVIKEMPDLALLITQVLLASKTLLGSNPEQLLCRIPYQDIITATAHSLKNLKLELNTDTRNVLLTYARIWYTLKTDTIHSKMSAADWAIDSLPDNFRPVMKRARSIYLGEQDEYWDDIKLLINPCADFMLNQINNQISVIMLSDNTNKFLKLAE